LRGNRLNWTVCSRPRASVLPVSALALAVGLVACGGSSGGSAEPTGHFQMKVVKAAFPTEQHIGQTSLMKIGVRNTGPRTVPAVAVTISIAGKEGQTSSLPFGIHDPQPELAQPDRPVWVLAESYPKVGSSTNPGGATGLSRKTFDFGPLKPGATVEGVWKLSAVKAGRYTVLYSVDAGISGSAEAKTASGTQPGGSFSVDIAERTPEVEVTDSGQVVEIGKGGGSGGQRGGAPGGQNGSAK
jgi:hypothetical protein